MATLRKVHPLALLCYLTLGLADLGLTLYLVKGSNGRVYEGNPVASAWLTSYGSLGLAAYKALAMTLFAGCVMLVSLRHPQTGKRLLRVACVITGGVVVYSAFLATSIARQPRPAPHLEERVVVIPGSAEEETMPASLQYQGSDAGSD
jgi:Domain of unknown function (DUF5658)